IKQNNQYQKPSTHNARGLFAFQNTQPTMHAAPRTNAQRQKRAVALPCIEHMSNAHLTLQPRRIRQSPT
ncbi:hypothetical protein PUV47_17340, partial [Pseudovibrio exalbescens]|uniref:hypothetical protein n=1 Tax=Pseudovibrio exalbescens TaxID=197461 RepID=UPI002365AAAB